MPIPVPFSDTALPVTDADTQRAEAFVAALARVMRRGSTGGTLNTPALLTPSGLDSTQVAPPGMGTPEAQLVFRQQALALLTVLPDWITEISGSGPVFEDNIEPSGVIDGENTVFELPSAPSPTSSLMLFRSGGLQKMGLHYNISGTTITYTALAGPPQSIAGEWHVAFYRR